MPTTRLLSFCLLWLCLLATPLSRAAERDQDVPVTMLRTLVVSGEQPGPGLWKVSKDGHTMWVLGTLTPLPRRMSWASREVEATIARSQEVLMPPSVSMNIDGAFMGGLFLLPSLLKARNNPEQEMLVDVLPAELYARWLVLKKRFLGRDRGVEKRRPIIAAQKLQSEALDDVDLSMDNIAAKVVRRAAKKHDIPLTQPQIEITITEPKKLVREFAESRLDDVECFRKTLDRLESDLETMKLRANAWALGEVAILRALPTTDTYRACTDALLETRVARQAGLDDLEARVAAKWLEAAEAALDKHERSFAMLPMPLVLREDGFLATLAARGYVVESPEDRAAADEEAAPEISRAGR